MLVGVMTYMFVLMVPSILHFFNLVFKGDIWNYILLITPSEASIQLIQVGFKAEAGLAYYLSLAVLILGSIFGYFFYIKPNFKKYAVKQSGV